MEFQKIIDNNTDSFNQQMTADMKKCISKAWREHGVRMPMEKAVLDNVKHSEEWFEGAYKKVIHIFGGASALVNIDFKEFLEVLGCVQDEKQVQELIQVCNFPSLGKGKNDGQNSSGLSLQKQYSNISSSSIRNIEGQKNSQLVCAAKNLHLSLMRCQWMVEVQQLIG